MHTLGTDTEGEPVLLLVRPVGVVPLGVVASSVDDKKALLDVTVTVLGAPQLL